MKKTLTVNLGGTVFHIDEDAYRLLDKYLSNLRIHFKKETGAEEIVNDIELRISELFMEKVNSGVQVITIESVEEVIERVGRPEEMENTQDMGDEGAKAGFDADKTEKKQAPRRFYRDPDDRILGGVAGGLAAYLGWDVTAVRIGMVLLLILPMVHFPIFLVYLILWLIVPQAKTAPEKLAMKGESVTVETIGKTVTDGFEKVSNGVNDFVNSGKPRSTLQKIGDTLIQIIGIILKVFLVLLAIVFSPVLFVLAIVLFVLMVVAISVAFGGGAALCGLLPSVDWSLMSTSPLLAFIYGISGVLLLAIPLFGIVYAVFSYLFNWKPMSAGAKWTLVIIWILSLIAGIVLFFHTGMLPGLHQISVLNLI